MSTPQPPSADQLTAARLVHWRQNVAAGADVADGAVLTLDSARQFVARSGLLLFTPRPQHINSPAPSFVEATLGSTSGTPSISEQGEARALLARLVAEGSAVPLNLLGAPGTTPDTPDFIASASVFSYVFTMRGDKAFKQLPSTSGTTKVSPLALNTYNLLLEHGPTTASQLTTALGKEVTEAAVLRTLDELWQHLRVLPVLSPEGGVTVWETATHRFTKQLKAGANAGQPSAMSALISLYLSQALLATEGEIETFLSPLAPRSRVRDVLHALTGARQLESIAVEGKTYLHIHGELPSFEAGDFENLSKEQAESTTENVTLAEGGSRIKRFVPKPRKIGTGYIERAKPFRPAGGPSREGRPPARRSFSGEADRRPRNATSPRSFSKPWEEEKQQRAARTTNSKPAGTPEFQDLDLDASAPAEASRPPAARGPRRDFKSSSRPTGDRASFSKPRFGGDRPAFGRGRDDRAESRPPRREGFDSTTRDSAPRKPYQKSGFGGRKETFGSRPSGEDKFRRPFQRDETRDSSRSSRREFSPTRPDAANTRGGDSVRPKPFRDRPEDGSVGGRPFRKFDAPRGPRKPFVPPDESSVYPPRREPSGLTGPGTREARPYSRPAEGAGRGDRPPSNKGERSGFAGKREGGGYAGKREGSGYAGKREGGSSFGKREGGSYAGKKFAGARPPAFAGKKPGGAKPSHRPGVDAPGVSTFDKFKGGNKPWGKRPPGRKPKPDEGEA